MFESLCVQALKVSVCVCVYARTLRGTKVLIMLKGTVKKFVHKKERKRFKSMQMIDGWSRRREGGGEGVRLNVSTWLVIQSDYRRLTAPTGRHP